MCLVGIRRHPVTASTQTDLALASRGQMPMRSKTHVVGKRELRRFAAFAEFAALVREPGAMNASSKLPRSWYLCCDLGKVSWGCHAGWKLEL